jgi:hypothetical protein
MQFSVLFLAAVLFQQVLSKELNEDEAKSTDKLRLELWARGAFNLDEENFIGSIDTMNPLSMRMGPVSYARRDVLRHRDSPDCEMSGYCSNLNRFRGGSQGQSAVDFEEQTTRKIEELGARYGQDFLEAIEKNKKEHAEDCKASCEIYFCASPDTPLKSFEELTGETTMQSYSMGPVPPEDFAESFG